ncbi:MAG: ATP-binding protein [Candidatus Omnitrophota bacterium]|jgi:tRNA 2-thiocytidine biosynthesis protein TtcA
MRGLTAAGERINSKVGKALHDYDLIGGGDRILVAVSGGKDSYTLLSLLKAIQGWAPVKFELVAAHIKTDFRCGECMNKDDLRDLFEDMGVAYKFREINVLDKEGKTTCFWCSWNRRKALFEMADELGCNKVALGHHKDDIAETVLMNLLYNGEISAMNPRQEIFEGKITIIRPLCYVEEKVIKKFAKENKFPEQLCKCPFGSDSKRKYVKKFIKETEKETPKVNIKTNIFRSINRIRTDYVDLREEKDQ